MSEPNHRIHFSLHSTRVALLALLLLPAIASSAQAPSSTSSDMASRPTQPTLVRIENVVHVVGLDDKPGDTGYLTFDEKVMTLNIHGHSTAIPLHSILAFSIAHDDKSLIRGIKGQLAEAAPYGVGAVITSIRPSTDVLTVFYKDAERAVRGCVLVLPKDTGKGVVSALARAGLSPMDYPKAGNLTTSEAQRDSETHVAPIPTPAKPSIEVALPSETADGIPPAFVAAVFEDLIKQLAQSGLFSNVWRAGDIRATQGTLVLHMDIENWKKGSARQRGLVPFTGATVIKTRITLVGAPGRTVFQGEVDGAKRTKGESLDVTNSLAKHVRKALEKAPGL
ncbi:DUF4410 domain-containing protein [Granulicella sp. 5B5]|uniref:DUF4410 domain-containing protein n=1 Tax=Granulicella sp. 5B5 TaxID=1617967 RepID=UPI0015F50EF0|nr:DUF4410 domain-containing protein [Granulicella sp. 5B5]QMV19538.1 DUF4410 domain-containing protein [Granulicella sp. 5B5]